MAFDINTRAVLGCLHAGIGESRINNILSTMNILTLNSSTFKKPGKGWDSCGKHSQK